MNEAGRACIADFGISCIRHDKTLSATITDTARGFTLRWAAPELLDGESVATRASDVWAFASVCYEVRLTAHWIGTHLIYAGRS